VQLNPELAQYEPEAKSPARRPAMERLARFARVSGAPLLVLGERGTGKTRLVETFVARLKRRQRVETVPCGGLDSSLAESFLFGQLVQLGNCIQLHFERGDIDGCRLEILMSHVRVCRPLDDFLLMPIALS
jgi:Cdc6-like AAA superfamily ATPase